MYKYQTYAKCKWMGLCEVTCTFTSSASLSEHHVDCSKTFYIDDEDLELVFDNTVDGLLDEMYDKLTENSNITPNEYNDITTKILENVFRKRLAYYKVLTGRLKPNGGKQKKETWKSKLTSMVGKRKNI